jgi:hypothetical protein
VCFILKKEKKNMKTIVLVISIIFYILFMFYAALAIFGFIYRPRFVETFIQLDESVSGEQKNCLSEQVKCNTVDDCKKQCRDATIEMQCTYVDRPSHLEGLYGESGNYCLPAKPESGCDASKGGIWVWSGYSAVQEQKWECLCTYPDYAGNNTEGCSTYNANVCQGGTMNYDATTANRPPSADDCTCPPSTTRLEAIDGTQLPLCVPQKPYLCDSKEMCESMYYPYTCTDPILCPPKK